MKGLPYYTVRKGNGYWQPTPEMKRAGFLPEGDPVMVEQGYAVRYDGGER
jgi:hypothetical protein